ncbi:Uncharacterised protein [Neisseria meningitidis]|nr:Uncharacterised protein [Neisseria meningitidis]
MNTFFVRIKVKFRTVFLFSTSDGTRAGHECEHPCHRQSEGRCGQNDDDGKFGGFAGIARQTRAGGRFGSAGQCDDGQRYRQGGFAVRRLSGLIGRCGREIGGGTRQRGRIRCVGCEPRTCRRGNRTGAGNRPGSAFEKRTQGSGGRLRLYPDRLSAFADAVDA